MLKTCAIPRLKIAAFESVLDHFAVNTFPVMESEVSRWLSSISCGFDLKHLAKDFEDRGFTTKASLKYVESSDLNVFFPSLLKLSYVPKKLIL